MIDALTKLALLGTANATTCPSVAEQIDALVDPLGSGSVEDAVLLKAGAASFYSQAGKEATAVSRLEEAAEESLPVLPLPVQRIFSKAWEPTYSVLMPDFLRVISERGLRLPPSMLPQALAIKDEGTRLLVKVVAGERGRWLAKLNNEWNWLLKSDQRESVDVGTLETLKKEFEHGSVKERCQILYAVRAKSPQVGREWLVEAFPSEGADTRAQLLEQFAIGLSSDDEEFLESCLDGRSVNVRAVACDLLAQLPDSAYVVRMTQRADAMLSGAKSGILRKTLKLTCQPPLELTKEDERDGLLAKPPTQVGKRSFWVEQILKGVPLSHWTKVFSSTPGELLTAISNDDYAENILRGWLFSAIVNGAATSDQNWLLPLWEAVLAPKFKIEQPVITGLWGRLSNTDKESALTSLMTSNSAQLDRLPFNALVDSLEQPWSNAFSKAYVTQFSNDLRANRWLPSWVLTFETAVAALPTELLEQLIKLDEPNGIIEKLDSSYIKSALSKFVDQARTRRQFYEVINQHFP